MQAGFVAVHDPVAVARAQERLRQVFETGVRPAALRRPDESQASLGKEDAVRLRQENAKLLVAAFLRAGDVFLVQQALGGTDHELRSVLVLRRSGEIFQDHDAQGDVVRRGHILDLRPQRAQESGQQKALKKKVPGHG